jgi:hypothetical protein
MKKDSHFQKDMAERKAFEKLPENCVKVLPTLESPHRIVADTAKVLSWPEIRQDVPFTPSDLPVISLYIDAKMIDRALRVSDALFKALENRGVTITTQNEKKETINATFIIHGVEILYRVEEVIKIVPFSPETKEEYRLRPHKMPKRHYRRTRLLRLKGKYRGDESILIEHSHKPIENQLNSFILALYRQAYKALDNERSLEEYRQKNRGRDERFERFREYLENKQQKIEDLKSMAAAHHEAGLIRELLHDMAAAGTQQDPEWMAWAKGYVDEIDPVKSQK